MADCILILDHSPRLFIYSALKYHRFGSCGLDPMTCNRPRSTSLSGRLRVARAVRPMTVAISPVVENGNPDGCAVLGIVGMHDGVDDGFAHRHRREIPAFLAPHGSNFDAMQGMFLDKGNGLLDSMQGKTPDFQRVDDMGLVGSPESTRLNPGIRKVLMALLAEEQHSAFRGHLAPLVSCHQPQRFQVGSFGLSQVSKRLGSSLEVERFRVAFGHRLFVKGLATGESPQFTEQFAAGAAIGRACANEILRLRAK